MSWPNVYLDNKCLFGDALDDKNFGNQKHNEELIKPKRTKSKLSEIYTINIQSLILCDVRHFLSTNFDRTTSVFECNVKVTNGWTGVISENFTEADNNSKLTEIV